MRHRLLCCSDTHGRLPPPLDEAGATAWLHAGDICNGPEVIDTPPDPLDDLLAPVARWFKERPLPIHLVSGNHDIADVYHAFRQSGDLSGRVAQVADRLFVVGIGWHGERYFELPYERDLEPVCQSVIRQAMPLVFGKDRVILLTHYPPRFVGTHQVENDRDGGGVWYDCIRAVVDLLEPLAVIQGHNHRWFGASHRVQLATREALIINPGPDGLVLEVDVDLASVRIVEP